MNLLAFLALLACGTFLIFFGIMTTFFDDEVSDLIKAITERIRNPKPSMLEELHRHWEESDRINRWPLPQDKDDKELNPEDPL